jgi:hypothetical protein
MRHSYVVPMRWMVIYEYEVPEGALNPSSTKLPRPWSPWGSSPSSKNPHGITGNRIRDLMISNQKLWPLNHEAGPITECNEQHVASGPRVATLLSSRKMRERKRITGGRIKWNYFYWQSKLLLLILSQVYLTSMHDGAGCQNKNAINGWRGVSRKWIWEDLNRFVRSEYSAFQSFESGNLCEQREWYFKTKPFKNFSFCSKRCTGGIR